MSNDKKSIPKIMRNIIEKNGIQILRVGKNSFFTHWERPKYEKDIILPSDTIAENQCGVLLQGKVLLEDDFTIETIKLYKKAFPCSPIVLSTWKNERKEVINKAEAAGAIICLSNDPDFPGDNNENRQRISSFSGITKLEELGCKYVLKSRTDQRIYGINIFPFFLSLLDGFPIEIVSKARKRIVSTSLSTFSNRLYNISDMLLFGEVEDMKRFFSPPEYRSKDIEIPYDQIEYSKLRRGEIYFTSHYIESCGHKLMWSIEDSDYYRRELFVIIDSSGIDLYWPKYSNAEYRWRRYQPDLLREVTFKDWFIDYTYNKSRRRI